MRRRARVVPIVMAGVLATAAALLAGGPATSSTAGARAPAAAAAASSPSPSPSPSGKGLIAYSSGFILVNPDVEGPSQVFTVRPDGTGKRQLTHVPDGRQAGAPDISPDGKSIVYVSNEGADNFAVWRMKTDGSSQHRVFGRNGFDFFQPRWSPNGKRLVVTRCDASVGLITNCDILLADADGSHQHTLVGGGRFSGNAAWSPNGKLIAFDSDLGGYLSSVWVVKASGGKPVRLTKPELEALWPNWSPDGTHLVISSNCCRPVSHVYTMRSDGSGLKQLTHATDGGGAFFASYSPDGKQITYGSDQLRGPDFDHLDLFVMNTDGSHQHRILEGDPNVVGPDWQRGR